MIHVRPQKVFALLDEPPSERVIRFAIPFQQGTGGTVAVENMLLISAMRTVKAKRVFEFGTFFGRTSLNLALNLPEDGELFTLDLDDVSRGTIRQSDPNAALTRFRADSPLPMDFYAHECRRKIRQLKGDSPQFNFGPYLGNMDMVFVDGGHEI